MGKDSPSGKPNPWARRKARRALLQALYQWQATAQDPDDIVRQFMEDAPRKFFRLKPGGEVRLRSAYIIQCDEVVKDDEGNVIELHCSYDPETRSGTGTTSTASRTAS